MQRKPIGLTAILIFSALALLSATALLANEEDVEETAETWPPGVKMSSESRSPVIDRAPSGEMMMVYSKGAAASGPDIYYRVSSPAQNGSAWGTEVNLANTTGTVLSPMVKYDDLNRAHIVWIEQGANWTIYYARWASGTIDISPKSISAASATQFFDVDVAISGSNVVVVWDQGPDIKESISTNGGVSFGVIDQDAVNDAFFNPYNSLAIEAGNNGLFHLALDRLATSGGNNVYYTRRSINGTTIGAWQGTVNLTTDTVLVNNSSFPDVAVADGTVSVSFGFRSPSNQYAMYLRSCPESSACSVNGNWSAGQNISGQFVRLNDSPLFIPDLTSFGGELFGSYSGYLGANMNEQIWTTKACNDWSENNQVAVTSDAVDSINPRMIASKAAGQPNFRFHMVYTNLADSSVYYASTEHVCYPAFLPSVRK